ncbi:ABCA5 protein, partial [Crotophaga sulcirostris]|nr:ABCA5 protein [Crotophaga sulcirostris]
MCGAEPINCFPVLLNILSNTFLRLFNSTERFRVWNDPYYSTRGSGAEHGIFFFYLSYMLILTAGLPPLFAVSNMEDYKVKSMH